MAVCPLSRSVLLAGLCFAGLCSAAWSPARAEGVVWLTDRSAALRQAQKQGKLLLVVHVSSDFTASPLKTDELTLYETTALADPRAAALLRSRYVPLAMSVG